MVFTSIFVKYAHWFCFLRVHSCLKYNTEQWYSSFFGSFCTVTHKFCRTHLQCNQTGRAVPHSACLYVQMLVQRTVKNHFSCCQNYCTCEITRIMASQQLETPIVHNSDALECCRCTNTLAVVHYRNVLLKWEVRWRRSNWNTCNYFSGLNHLELTYLMPNKKAT